MLGHEVTKRYPEGLADDTIDVTLTGSAGQSLGAFVPRGITVRLFGDTNDYLGKGLSGGRLVVRPDRSSVLVAEQNVVAGNVVAYGATSGEIFVRGLAGERFCVRNSGATAVVEGVGDHALEYMTGGTVVILGRTGRNVAAGMSGGTAYVLDLMRERVNPGALTTGELELCELDDDDAQALRLLVSRHRDETGSAVAKQLLEDWTAARKRFTKLVPRDYRIVVEVREGAAAEGLDPDSSEVWTRITEASHG
jgi:glutamate synthase (NADPH/NADH) large chain